MRRIISLVFFMLTVAVWFPVNAGELEDRRAIRRQVSTYFQIENFAGIDRLSAEFRAQESRTSSGLWKRTMLYNGLYVPSAVPYDDAIYLAIEEKFRRWIEQNPQSTVAHIGYAYKLVEHAWSFRGTGWSRDVPIEAWKPFKTYLARAREHLLKHKKSLTGDPQWYFVMLVIAKGEGWPLDRFLALVEEGTAKHPYFYEIYFKAIDYLLPKWHGDRAMIEEFANLAVEKTQAHDGVGIYARIYWYTSQIQYGSALFTDTAVVWERMSAGIDDVLARYPDQWNINNFAHFACLARDREKARELLARVEGDPIDGAWGKKMAGYKVCKSWLGG